MLPDASIQIIENTPARLVILDPPHYLAGSVFLILGLVLACLWWLPLEEGQRQVRVGWPALAIATPFLIIGLILATTATLVTLSQESGTIIFERTYLHLIRRPRIVSLSDVSHAAVATDEQTRSLFFVLRSGEEIPLGSFSERKGYRAAADAANRFLGPRPLSH